MQIHAEIASWHSIRKSSIHEWLRFIYARPYTIQQW